MKRSGSIKKYFLVCLACQVFLSMASVGEKPTRSAFESYSDETDLPLPEKYSRLQQGKLRWILDREPEQAIKACKDFLQEYPEDADTHYLLSAALSVLGDTREAVANAEKSLDLGLPPQRYLSGPRFLFASIQTTPFWKSLEAEYANQAVHGPMLSGLTERSVRIWVRTAREAQVKVHLSRSGEFGSAMSVGPVQSTAETDFTATLDLEGLEADTSYDYAIEINGVTTRDENYHFRTSPIHGEAGVFRIAFGGGAPYRPHNERMWEMIRSHEPHALLMLGDNVYLDDPWRPAMQRFCYSRRFSRPEWRRLVGSTPAYAIWDDHDFAENDSWGGPEPFEPFDWENPLREVWSRGERHLVAPAEDPNPTAGFWYSSGGTPVSLSTAPTPPGGYAGGPYLYDSNFKWVVWDIFRQNWANPGYGDPPDWPGCWHRFSIGDVDFFLLDCRTYRTNPYYREEASTMLGPIQKAWLMENLQSSKATFKVLASSVPWEFHTKGDSLDTWNGYREERNEIFQFIEEHRIDGVVLISADRHRSDAYRIERENGYPFYEFESSHLTHDLKHKTQDHAIFSYNETAAFGELDFDTTLPDPQVTYKIVTIDGEVVHSLKVKKSEISFPTSKTLKD